MKSNNKKKNDQLGQPHGTARNRLVKSLLFSFVQQTGKDTCFQCNCKIETVEELSIEHKVPWLDSESPVELFFDPENIAYSHLKCNVSAARRGYTTTDEFKKKMSEVTKDVKRNNGRFSK